MTTPRPLAPGRHVVELTQAECDAHARLLGTPGEPLFAVETDDMIALVSAISAAVPVAEGPAQSLDHLARQSHAPSRPGWWAIGIEGRGVDGGCFDVRDVRHFSARQIEDEAEYWPRPGRVCAPLPSPAAACDCERLRTALIDLCGAVPPLANHAPNTPLHAAYGRALAALAGKS